MRTKSLLMIGVVAIPLMVFYIIRAQSSHTVTPPRIVVSKETTRLLGPLTADWHVDYVAAANELASHGVTPENNAVVLLWQALGPADVPHGIRSPYFKLLGVPPTGPSTNFIQGLRTAVAVPAEPPGGPDQTADAPGPAAPATLDDQLQQAIEHPWSAADFPQLAAWFSANAKSIKLLDECTRRSRYYSPLVCEGNRQMVVGTLLPAAQQLRQVARVLMGRGMLLVAAGELDQAFEDCLACHRLGRLVGQGPTLVESMVALTIDGMATRLDRSIAESKALTPAQATGFPAALKALKPLPDLAEKIDSLERFSFLDVVESIEDGRAKDAAAVVQGTFDISKMLKLPDGRNIDLNQALRSGNIWFDRISQAAGQSTCIGRLRVGENNRHAFDEMAAAIKRTELHLDELTDEELSCWAGDRLVSMFVPATTAAVSAKDRVAQKNELIQLAFAIAAYHLEKQDYPANLNTLVPRWVAEVPRDMFSDRDLHYLRTDRGYLLYSVGLNGVDDGGRDMDAEPSGDDISIQVPFQLTYGKVQSAPDRRLGK